MRNLCKIVALTILFALFACKMDKGEKDEIAALRDSIAVLSQKVAQEEDERNSVSGNLIEQAKTEIEAARQLLPLEGGVGLIITEMEYDHAENSIRYKYNYTIPVASRPSAARQAEAKKSALSIVKSQPKELAFLKGGISFHYDYYSMDDEYLYTMTITPEDITKN